MDMLARADECRLVIKTSAGLTLRLPVRETTRVEEIQEMLARKAAIYGVEKDEKGKAKIYPDGNTRPIFDATTRDRARTVNKDTVLILNPMRCPEFQGKKKTVKDVAEGRLTPNDLAPEEFEEDAINLSKSKHLTLREFGISDAWMEEKDNVLYMSYDHPMRAVELGNILEFSLWEAGNLNDPGAAKKMHDKNWKRGKNVKPGRKCSYFVSHAWNDEKNYPRKKVRMLRGFLCLQQLLVRWTICFPLIALFFVPLGFAIDAIIKEAAYNMEKYEKANKGNGGDGGQSFASLDNGYFSFVPWASVLLVYVLLLAWLYLASKDRLPQRVPPPWALYSTTLWLDKTCVRQDTDETIGAGTGGFSRFLKQCDQLIAFIGPNYFKRLWCVYELATFCRDKIVEGRNVQDHLLLLSLEWPSPLQPNKDPYLTNDERRMLETFSCLQVQCTKPSDRHIVLAAIRKNWREVDLVTQQAVGKAEDAHERFDDFVRKDLVTVLSKSKAGYSRHATTEISKQFELFFGSQ
jgi:hypothetical protein